MAVDTVVEEVADNLQELSEATRRINPKSVGYFTAGIAFGFALGFYWGYKFNKEKIRAEVFEQSEKEVAKIREVYQQKTVAATPKPSVEEIIEEKGYERPEVFERPLPAPVPGIVEPPVTEPVVVYDGGKDKDQGWDYPTEMQNRREDEPYVIHQDEFSEGKDGHSRATYTYYAGDDVLVDEANGHPLPHADMIVGQNNLRFGHGTDDIDVVFVRNDKLELDMEICRTADSYEEEVLGLENNENSNPD